MVIYLMKDKVAIVTGASRGIGRATALLFAREGAKIIVNYNKAESQAQEVVEHIQQEGGSAIAVQADIGNRDAVNRMVEEALREFGSLSILVNNAGVGLGGGPLLEFDEEKYDAMWQVNVKGILYCTHAVAPHMMKQQYGKIVNIGSVAGLGTALLPGNMLYASTKAAVAILTKRLALELGQYGINVNCIAPGLIRTDMSLGKRSPAEQKERMKYFEDKSMLKQIGNPDDIAHATVFLASDKAKFITGQVLTIDGGRIDFLTHSL